MTPVFTANVSEKFASFFNTDPIYPFAYTLYQEMIDGHICFDLNEINKICIQEQEYQLDLQTLQKSAYITSDINEKAPFYLDATKLYLFKYYNYESVIVDYINQINNASELTQARISKLKNLDNLTQLLDTFSDLKSENNQLIDWQFIATLKSFIQPFSIITGGPGTGKTTTIAKLLSLLSQEQTTLKIALAAPTGKAAVRMKEALVNNPIFKNIEKNFPDIEAMTIHRLLGSIKDSHYFKHTTTNPLDAQVIIVDEASMIDLPLMSKLIMALEPTTRLILLGDQNQLSSVGAGSLLKDFCENVSDLKCISSEVYELLKDKLAPNQLGALLVKDQPGYLQDNITELQFSRRFSNDSSIGRISQAILNNDLSFLETPILSVEEKDSVVIDEEYKDRYLDEIVAHYKEYIIDNDINSALKSLNNNRVLCAVKDTDQGVNRLNSVIEQKLAAKGLLKLDKVFYHNRPIMITKNNPELQVYNGDIGIIRDDKAYFNVGKEELLVIQPGLLSDYETVFAMTIHKSQGSEFDHILIVLPKNEDSKLLTKQLLYTGVTRAKKKVIIQGSKAIVAQTVSNEVNRISGLTNRLNTL